MFLYFVLKIYIKLISIYICEENTNNVNIRAMTKMNQLSKNFKFSIFDLRHFPLDPRYEISLT